METGGGLSLPAPPHPVKSSSAHHRLSPHRMSVQVPARNRVPLARKCKSLPNVNVVAAAGAVFFRGRITASSSTSHCAVSSSDKKSRPKILKKTWDRVKTIIQSPQRKGSDNNNIISANNNKACSSAPSTPSRAGVFDFDEEFDESERIKRNYALLQKRLSEELHQRMNECSRDSPRVADHLSEEFKKRLQQWEMWKASTGKVQYTSEELLQIIPVEFSKKLIEWECIRHGGGGGEQARSGGEGSSGLEKGTRNKAQRNKKESSVVMRGGGLEDSRVQELAWLDKQLEKIDVEKKRLEREMKKYLEREARLEKMREALKHGPTTDVVIRTPTAKCRVERIDEKFAMRLYEWEEKMGVEPESSAMALLNPKYFDVKDNDQQQGSSSSNAISAVVVADDDEDVVLGPLDLINARLDAADTGEDASVRRAMEHVADALAEADGDGRISSAASSCCCSADYDDPTDSFATKNNSGASNTDSELFYKPEPRRTAARRRSSDAISTPLSDARSPSLSAFTSDDEGDTGLLKTVSEEIDDGGGGGVAATVVNNKDAESQTEVILRAKPIVVEDETILDDELACDNPGVFVQTKRTIFTPILGDEDDDDDEVGEEAGEDDEQVQHSPVGRKNMLVGSISSIPSISSPPCWKKFECDDEPECGAKVVGAIPKTGGVVEETNAGVQYKPQPKTQLHRSFPKVGKIPVWCSPLVARRQFAHTQPPPQQIPIITTPDDSADFSIDKFLQESKLLDAAVNGPPPSISDSLSTSVPSSFQLQPPKRMTSRLPKTNPLVPRKYTIGGGFPPGGRGALLTRSNSFGFPGRGGAAGSEEIYCGEFQRGSCSAGVGYATACGSQASGSDVSLVRSVGEGQFEGVVVQGVLSNEERGGGTLHCVTKSKSTGSIKSKFGRAIARAFGGGSTGSSSSRSAAAGGDAVRDQNQNDGQHQGDAVVADRRGSGSSRLRRFGSWIPRVGGGGGGSGSKAGE